MRAAILASLIAFSFCFSSCSLIRRAETVDRRQAPPPDPTPAPNPDRIPSQPGAGARTVYNSCQVPGPYLALTIDDGPHPSLTPRVLNQLRQRNVKATFFLIGEQVKMYPGIVRQMLADGHEIGNHTYTHATLTRLSDAGVTREIDSATAAVVEATGGYRPHVFRPPGGAFTTRQREWLRRDYGMPTIMWSVDPRDWQIRNTAHVQQQMIAGARPGGILLCHDIHATTVAALPTVVDTLLNRGFRFVTVGSDARLLAAGSQQILKAMRA